MKNIFYFTFFRMSFLSHFLLADGTWTIAKGSHKLPLKCKTKIFCNKSYIEEKVLRHTREIIIKEKKKKVWVVKKSFYAHLLPFLRSGKIPPSWDILLQVLTYCPFKMINFSTSVFLITQNISLDLQTSSSTCLVGCI